MEEKHRIEVDGEVWAFLQREAEPLIDSPNDVLRRLLLGGARRTSRSSGARGGRRDQREPYAAMGAERRAPGGLSPRRMGKLLVAREFGGEHFGRAAASRGGFRTMFESNSRLVYFLNFNKPGARNLLFRVTASAVETLMDEEENGEKTAYVIFSWPAERVAWVIPVRDLLERYRMAAGEGPRSEDLVVNLDPERNRLRESSLPGEWDISEYRREIDDEREEEG